MNQRLLLGVVAAIAIAIGVGVWWAGRSEPANAANIPRAEVVAAASVKYADERVRLEVPAEPEKVATTSAETPPEALRVEAAKTAPEWVQEILRSTPEQWKEQQQPLTYEPRVQEKQKIYDYFNAEAAPELERRQRNKEWEFIGPPQANGNRTYSQTKEEERQIYSIVFPVDGGVYKIALPPEQFSDLYTLKERADELISW